MYAKKDTMQESKYVLDCNVYISAIISKKLELLVTYIIENDIIILYCNELEAEIIDVLNRPHIKKYYSNTVDTFLKTINLFTKKVKITKKYTGCPDPKDDYLFALCISHNATLVTGDKKLQRFAESPIKVITTTAFKQIF